MKNYNRPYNYPVRNWFAHKLLYCFVVGALLFGQVANAEPVTVTLSGTGKTNPNEPYYYFVQALTLALEKTRASDGNFKIAFLDHKGGIERDRTMLAAGTGIDLMWGSVTQARAKEVRIINIDLLKGLNNYRVLLINKKSQPQFDKVKTLADLKEFKAGSGTYWTDGRVLDYNGFSVVYGANYNGLFKMLSMSRYDFLSRGLHEIGNDLVSYGDLGLIQEKNLLLKYEHPIRYCFFVNKRNEKLAERIERGLVAAQADGSFDELFLQMPMFKYGHEILQDSHRRIIDVRSIPNL